MVGYGPESNHFVVELTYNYGIDNYELGNDFDGITIKSSDIIKRAKDSKYPVIEQNGRHILISPGGYRFYILDEEQQPDQDPVVQVSLNVTDLQKSTNYWNNILQMKLLSSSDSNVIFSYGDHQAKLELIKINDPLNRAKAYGRIAFAVPWDMQPEIQETIKKNNCTILTDLIKLDTPGKATVRVIILADPDGHEICFVDEEGFSQLSQMEDSAEKMLDKYIGKDPFEKKK